MSTKKQFVEIMNFLKTNENKKVSTILDELVEMTETKKSNSNVLYDEDKNVVAIFCYYHKQWELVSEVEYGTKKNTASGLNTMCKIGTNAWTKQQSVAKKAKSELIDQVASGDVDPSDLNKLLEDIETERLTINTTNMPNGTKEMPKL